MSGPAVSKGAPPAPGPGAANVPATAAGTDPHARRNFILLTLDGTFFSAGGAFYDSNAVLPVFVSTLTSSRLLIGLAASARTLGWFLPQLFVASLTEHQRYKGRIVVVNSLLHRLALLVMAAIIYLYAGTRPGLALGLFFPIFLLAAMSEGINGVPWTDVVANTIPGERRGRLFAYQQVFGGLLAFGNGFLVRVILRDAAYPMAYVILFLATCFWFSGSIFSFMGVKEKPAAEVKEKRRALGDYLRSLPAAWRGNPLFARVMVARFALGFIYLSLPFFVLHAQENLGATREMAGLYVSAQMLGLLAGSLVAGRLSDRGNNRAVVFLALVTTLLTPVTALLLTLAASLGLPGLAVALFPLIYVFAGATFGGGYIGFTNYILQVAPAAERPTYIGLSNTLMAPFAFLSPLGGLLASLLGYPAVFALSAAVGLAGVVLAARLPAPATAAGAVGPGLAAPVKDEALVAGQ